MTRTTHTLTTPDAWKIPSGHDACTRCEAELTPGHVVTVSLSLGAEGPQRQDLCETCWKAVEGPGDAFFWTHRVPEAGSQRPVVDYAVLREVFERMLERPEEIYRRLSYLVGLVLIRKRRLRLRGFELRDDREVMIVSRGAGEPEIVVPAPFLSAEDMVDTRQHLARLLESDLSEGLPGLEEGEDTPTADDGDTRTADDGDAPTAEAGDGAAVDAPNEPARGADEDGNVGEEEANAESGSRPTPPSAELN